MGALDKKSLGLLFVLVFFIHAAKIPNHFTWLDHRDIEGGRALLALQELPLAFVRPFSDTHFYRPVVALSHSALFALFGANPFAYHAFNVLVHALVCVALARCAKSVFGLSDRVAFLSGFCGGILPASFLPAGQISHISELLLALFYLLSLIAYRRCELGFSRPRAAGFIAAFSLALLAKESALVFIPASLFLLEWNSDAGLTKEKTLRLALLTAPPAAVYLGLRFLVLPGGWALENPSDTAGAWIAVRLVTYARHLVCLLNPWWPPLSDAVHRQTLLSLPAVASLAGLALIAAALFKLKDKPLRIALILMLTLLTPTLNLLPLPRFFSSHYLYLPGLLFSVALARLLAQAPRPLKAALIVWIVIAASGTALSGQRLKDDEALFAPAVEKDGDYREGHFYLGAWFLAHASPEEAERHYMESLKPLPEVYSYSDPMAGSLGLALAEISLRNFEEAEAVLEAIEPNASGPDRANLEKIRGLLAARRANAL